MTFCVPLVQTSKSTSVAYVRSANSYGPIPSDTELTTYYRQNVLAMSGTTILSGGYPPSRGPGDSDGKKLFVYNSPGLLFCI